MPPAVVFFIFIYEEFWFRISLSLSSCLFSTQENLHPVQATHRFVPSFANAGPATPTADDEVGVEDAQGGLVGALLVVDGWRDDEAKGDAGDALQHNQDDDQHQRAFVWHL